MKRLFFSIVTVLFSVSSLAQDGLPDGLRIHIDVGFVVVDDSDFSSFATALGIDYDHSLGENVSVGATSGYTHLFGKDGFSDLGYIPLAGSVDVGVVEDFSIGADVGYAVIVTGGSGGDLLLRFNARLMISDTMDVTTRYSTLIGNGSSLGYIRAGLGWRF